MKAIFLLLLFTGSNFITSAQVRQEFLLEKNWKFTREDLSQAKAIDFNDSHWQNVTVPHDWAIYGPFDGKNDLQEVAITQDGEQQASLKSGRTGGLPFVGTGWYRTHFTVPSYSKNKRVTLLFDGAMSHARIYINGKEAGYWPYGYNSFYFDITDLLSEGKTNTLAVRLENLPESSRWYPGAGIYRNVHLIVTNDVHIPVWGTQLTTPVVRPDYAKVNLKTHIITSGKLPASKYKLVTELKNSHNETVAYEESDLTPYDENVFEQDFIIHTPSLWSPDSPELYFALSKVYENGILKDEYTTRFGIRSIEVIPEKGFYLNGIRTQFQGVCMHHDLGPLGAAINEAALRRQLNILKDMGCNAIRTSHNMPAPELINLCDEMGFMVMAESFDEWKIPKCQNGYNLLFDEWAEKDMVNLVRHYRNNPSIVMWCIGNEVPEQSAKGKSHIGRFLQDICHREDPTRPVTQGMDQPYAVINNNFAAVMDIPGFNYRPFAYPEAYAKLPQQLILGSETASTISARGVYKFPVERKAMAKYLDQQSSSYDVEHCSWSNLPEDDYIQHEDYPWCIGEFVWTGFDYLGEPTPYYEDWPSHSSLFGIVDLAGLPKDRYYLYRSHWNKKAKTLHIVPHWSWPGREGEITPVFVYTNYPSAELFINGKSQGKRSKDFTIKAANSGDKTSSENFTRQKRYRLMWMNTRYEPGTVKVVAYDENGKTMAEKEVHTAGTPHHIELIADRHYLKANGKDLAFITVKVVDKEGNLCPAASQLIHFNVKGTGSYRASANGDATCINMFHKPEMPLFNGMLTAIVQSSEIPGDIQFEASTKGLNKAILKLESR